MLRSGQQMDPMHRPGQGGQMFGWSMPDGLDPTLPYDDEDLHGPPVPEGAELLDNAERHFISSFFEKVKVHDGYSSSTFGEGLGGFYTNQWCFPPELVGHEVSYGSAVNGLAEGAFPDMSHMTLQNHQLQSASNPMLPNMLTQQPPRPQQSLPHRQHQHYQQPQHRIGDQHLSAEDLAAATTLSRSSGTPFGVMFNPMQEMPSVNYPVGPGQLHGYGGSSREVNTMSSNLAYGVLGGNESYTRRPRAQMEEVRFGSDTNFNRVNYVPQSRKETSEAMMAEQLATLGCLERNISAAPTRAPSPTAWAPPSPNGRRSSLLSPVRLKTATHNPLTPEELDNEDDGRPRKRRKSTKTGDGLPIEEPRRTSSSSSFPSQNNLPGTKSLIRTTSTTPVPRRQKQPGPPTPEADPIAGTRKRRKPSAVGAPVASSKVPMSKAPRENLTEEQKRENHIKSEQKRRNIIKMGFHDLCTVVPTLNGGGYSKASMLNLTADWLVDVIEGNRKLKDMLAQTEGSAIAV